MEEGEEESVGGGSVVSDGSISSHSHSHSIYIHSFQSITPTHPLKYNQQPNSNGGAPPTLTLPLPPIPLPQPVQELRDLVSFLTATIPLDTLQWRITRCVFSVCVLVVCGGERERQGGWIGLFDLKTTHTTPTISPHAPLTFPSTTKTQRPPPHSHSPPPTKTNTKNHNKQQTTIDGCRRGRRG